MLIVSISWPLSRELFALLFTSDSAITDVVTIKDPLPTDFSRQVIGAALCDWSAFDVAQFQMGLEVELEHGVRNAQTNVTDDDALTTGKIALAHLKEFPDFYTRLLVMEKEADEYWAKG